MSREPCEQLKWVVATISFLLPGGATTTPGERNIPNRFFNDELDFEGQLVDGDVPDGGAKTSSRDVDRVRRDS